MTRQGFEAIHGTNFVFAEEYTGPVFSYGYRNRPFAMAHQPKGFIIGSVKSDVRISEKGVRHGTIDYPFRLTEDEIYSFELVDLNEDDYHSIKYRIEQGRPLGGAHDRSSCWQHGVLNNTYSPLHGMEYVYISDGGDYSAHFPCGCAAYYSVEDGGSYGHYPCSQHEPEKEE